MRPGFGFLDVNDPNAALYALQPSNVPFDEGDVGAARAAANVAALAQSQQFISGVSNKTLITLGFVAGGTFLLLALTGRRR
jgi:hypothetical protein